MNNIIITSSEFIISQDNRKKSLFEIKCNKNNNTIFPFLLRSLTISKIIKNYTILDDGNTLMIKASSIKTYHDFKNEQKILNKTDKLSYTNLLKIAYYLSRQLSYLITNEYKCFYTYDPNNIIVIDNNIFVYLSQEHLKEIKNENICIYHPISKKNNYLSPELLNTTILPIMINFKTIFYSLGLIILESLSSNSDDNNKLNSFKETKLYYFLERCLNKNPNERYILYI
jgi:hypothetical protein